MTVFFDDEMPRPPRRNLPNSAASSIQARLNRSGLAGPATRIAVIRRLTRTERPAAASPGTHSPMIFTSARFRRRPSNSP